jgi:GGDEF domain-containing protein
MHHCSLSFAPRKSANMPLPVSLMAGLNRGTGTLTVEAPIAAHAYVLVEAVRATGKPVVHVLPSDKELAATAALCEFLAPKAQVLRFPAWDTLPYDRVSPSHPITATRVETLGALAVAESDVNVVFAIMRMDRYEKSVARYGKEACAQLLMHVHHICRSTFRADDLIFSLSGSTLGLVLFNISPESARVVFNRLRWKVRNHRFAFGGKADFSISTCIGFDLLDLEDIPGMMARSEATMAALDANERNMLVEFKANAPARA